MSSRIGMAIVITIVAALSITAPVFATTILTEAETDQRDKTDDDKRLLPSSKTTPRKNGRKELLSLLWSDGDSSPISFPAVETTKATIKPNSNLWSFFRGGRKENNASKKEDNFQKDQEKIRQTLKKFYRLADPKFAKASLASVRKSNKRLPGSSQTDDSRELDISFEDGDDLLPGTILDVYTESKSENFDDDDADNGKERDGKQTLLEDHAYELVEKMQQELGATPKHYMDFAYRSVTASSSSTSTRSKRRASRSDDFLIGVNIGDIISEDTPPTCKVVVATEELAEDRGKGDDNVEEDGDCSDNDSDRAMEFLASWWKWWLPFANSQWWKNNGSSNTDYESEKSPFAAGSNGEVWRGRRRCRRNGNRKPARDIHDDHSNGNDNRAFLNTRLQRENLDNVHPEDDWSEENFENFEHDQDRQTNNDDDADDDCDDQTPLVLKRLRVERGYLLLEAGLREVYFGKLIARVLEDTNRDMYTVYVDHFFREVPRAFAASPHHRSNDLELWIVYEDAGPSLRSYMYSPIVSESGFVMHQHSKLWTKLRTRDAEEEGRGEWDDDDDDDDSCVEVQITDEPPVVPRKKKASSSNDGNNYKTKGRNLGRLFLQKTIREILASAAELHKRGIVHRDIKPSNVMCQSDQPLRSLEELLFESEQQNSFPNIVCKLGDFSSGWDRYTSEHLYTKGPTPGEQTDEYAPPESYVGPYWKPFDEDKPQSYDSWSIGVMVLELLLGTPNVFSVDQRTSALLTVKLKRARASDEEIAYAMYLAALSNFCIFVSSNETSKRDSWPLRYGDPLHKTAMVKESCTLQDFHRALRARDPLGIGFDSSTDLLLHLIWQLLAFDPSERMTAEEALRHPYFISPDGTLDSLYQIPGYHNALISEMLDERIDFDIQDEIKTFQCPACGRVFHDWSSCHQHANLRKHAKFCVYNHTVLPSCINTHSMLPEHPTSGYCDLQGRRKTIEDFHSIHLHHGHQFYGIFDGHTGNLASKFAASELYTELLNQLPDLMQIDGKKSQYLLNSDLAASDDRRTWKEEIQINVTKAFEAVHERFLDRITTMTSAISDVGSAPKMDQSGTTATALLVTEDVVIAAVLGDSRGVLASAKTKRPTAASDSNSKSSSSSASPRSRGKSQWNRFPEVSAIPFSIDHVASDPSERELVLKRGGFVSKSGNTARVNGTLAITRSIGDANLAPVLSREPHVRVFDRSELRELCGELGTASSDSGRDGNESNGFSSNTSNNTTRTVIPCFAILASDGLWDVMSNQEAVDMVVEIILRHNEAHASSFQPGDTTREVALFPSHDDDDDDDDEENVGPFQESAERLAVEAYVRGSTDNIGVCVVAID